MTPPSAVANPDAAAAAAAAAPPSSTSSTPLSLPPALDFPAMEETICQQWKDDGTFKTQDRLSVERGDPVRDPRSKMVIHCAVVDVLLRLFIAGEGRHCYTAYAWQHSQTYRPFIRT
jgi:hypothetical protein